MKLLIIVIGLRYKVSPNLTHSWWTFVFRLIPEKTSFKWDDFRNEFRANGGDSFYGAWSLSYLEPAFLA